MLGNVCVSCECVTVTTLPCTTLHGTYRYPVDTLLPFVLCAGDPRRWQIFPDRKTKHFEAIRKASGVDFHDMIFFDNEFRNIADVSALGVCCVYVPDGLDLSSWEKGLQQFAEGVAAGKHTDFSKDRRRGWY
jgi:hypothetical protein